MNGNTHFDAAAMERPQLVTEETANDGYVAEEGITDETMQFSALNRIAEATLALAYEQRTANLVAYWNALAGDAEPWQDTPFQRELDDMHRDIRVRLGRTAEVPK